MELLTLTEALHSAPSRLPGARSLVLRLLGCDDRRAGILSRFGASQTFIHYLEQAGHKEQWLCVPSYLTVRTPYSIKRSLGGMLGETETGLGYLR